MSINVEVIIHITNKTQKYLEEIVMRNRLVIMAILVMSFAVVFSGCGKSEDEDKNKNSQQMMEEIVEETEDDFVQEIGKNEVTQETEKQDENTSSLEENNQVANSEAQKEQTQQKPTVTPTPEPEVQTPVQPTPEPEVQVPVQSVPEPEVQQPTVSNVFFNDTNYAYDLNALSIKPRYVYWENGKLYAECFVINGFKHTVYNINVKSLYFSNSSVNIAEASFGGLNNVSIAPYSYIVWTFVFGDDCVITPDADLTSGLRCRYETSNSY